MKRQKKLFFISPVRSASPETLDACKKYVVELEQKRYKVFWPIRDNPHEQIDPVGDKICDTNLKEIFGADEIHIWYLKESTGIHFDTGAIYMLVRILGYKKKIVFVNKKEFANNIDMHQPEHKGKSFMRVLDFLDKSTK